MPTWDEFVDWALEQGTQGGGRRALRRRWESLRALADEVSRKLDPGEIEALFGKSYAELDPEHNDLKALVAYGAGRGIITNPALLHTALRADGRSDPLHFLAQHSGKTFGETYAPRFAEFWLAGPGDHWEKQSSKGLYDVAWTPLERGHPIRIELKASSEHPSYRFQQIRHPKSSGSGADYDLLLCVGVSARALEWWAIPIAELDQFAETGSTAMDQFLITRHHGKRRPIWNNEYGYEDEGWYQTDPKARALLTKYAITNSEMLRSMVLSLV